MKWLVTSIVFMISFSLMSQSNVMLKINHQMAGDAFKMNQVTQNNLGNPFDFTRFEYYLSQFSIVHDGGQETAIEDLYVLANANEELIIDLGAINATSIEEVRFYIGIDQATNHLDPASYDMSHPLAPKNPSMHWGWASGYRFVALEGNGGNNQDYVYQIHALGNINYTQAIIPVSKTVENNQAVIEIDADYIEALRGIKVEQGLFTHGEKYEAKSLIFNMANSVFKESSIVSSTEKIDFLNNVKVYPNPTLDGTFVVSNKFNVPVNVEIFNGIGQKVLNTSLIANESKFLTLEETGMYFVKFEMEGNIVSKPILFTK